MNQWSTQIKNKQVTQKWIDQTNQLVSSIKTDDQFTIYYSIIQSNNATTILSKIILEYEIGTKFTTNLSQLEQREFTVAYLYDRLMSILSESAIQSHLSNHKIPSLLWIGWNSELGTWSILAWRWKV